METEISKKLNDKEFNRHLASFENEIRESNIEFPYLDVLKRRQVYEAITNSQHLTQDDKDFLSLYHKGKNEPGGINAEETSRLEAAIGEKLNDIEFNRRFASFETGIRESNIEFPYLDTLKRRQVYEAIYDS